MDTYEIFLLLHIVGAICWVGADTFLFLTSRRVLARGNGTEIRGFMSDVSFLGPRFFIPVSLLTVVFGALTVVEGPWGFDQPWVVAGLTMFFLSFIMGAALIQPRVEKLDAMGEAGDIDSPEYRELVGNVLRISRIEFVLLWAIVVLMVIKPG